MLAACDELVEQFPEWGRVVKEVWLSRFGGCMKVRYTFVDLKFEIAPGDIVHPTMEVFCSYDTSLAQSFTVGGWRIICSNGMVIGKILAKYKHKHTLILDLDDAKMVIAEGMANYSQAANLWKGLTERDALLKEVLAFQKLGFNKAERNSVEAAIKSTGKVKRWEDDDLENIIVQINAWELFNIYTEEASHRIDDIVRRERVSTNIAHTFVH